MTEHEFFCERWMNPAAVNFELRGDIQWMISNGYIDELREIFKWAQEEMSKREHDQNRIAL
jgi:hypothetical protein